MHVPSSDLDPAAFCRNSSCFRRKRHRADKGTSAPCSPGQTPRALSATSLELPAAHPSPSGCQLFVAPGERIACAPAVQVELKKKRRQARHTFLYASLPTPNATRMNLAEIGYHNLTYLIDATPPLSGLPFISGR